MTDMKSYNKEKTNMLRLKEMNATLGEFNIFNSRLIIINHIDRGSQQRFLNLRKTRQNFSISVQRVAQQVYVEDGMPYRIANGKLNY